MGLLDPFYDPWAGEGFDTYPLSDPSMAAGLTVPYSPTPVWQGDILWVPYTDLHSGRRIMVDADSAAGRAARGATMFDLSYPTFDGLGLEPRLTEYGTGFIEATTQQTPTGSTQTGGTDLNLSTVLNTASNIIGTGIAASKSGSGGSLEDSAVRALNEVEKALLNNRNQYLAGAGGLNAQSAALRVFDQAWAWIVSSQGLANPALGAWGRVGIQDRTRGGKFDWFAAYRDPIAQDTRITSNPITGAASKVQQALGVSSTVLAILAVGVGVLLYRRYA